jgi:hypothetical protein
MGRDAPCRTRIVATGALDAYVTRLPGGLVDEYPERIETEEAVLQPRGALGASPLMGTPDWRHNSSKDSR